MHLLLAGNDTVPILVWHGRRMHHNTPPSALYCPPSYIYFNKTVTQTRYIVYNIVMTRYGRGGKRWIRYDTAQNIAIRYDIRPQDALPYVTVNSARLMQRSH